MMYWYIHTVSSRFYLQLGTFHSGSDLVITTGSSRLVRDIAGPNYSANHISDWGTYVRVVPCY